MTEDYDITIDTKVFGMRSISIPEDALVCLEEKQPEDNSVVLVEYNGFHDIEVPQIYLKEIVDFEEVEYEEPVVKKACMDWKIDCPFQLDIIRGQRYTITKENEEYYYVHLEEDEYECGWAIKSLFN